MKCRQTAWAWLGRRFEKALVLRVKRLIDMRKVRLLRSANRGRDEVRPRCDGRAS